MATHPPVQSGAVGSDGTGHRVQLVQVGNTGSEKALASISDLQALGGTSFVLAVPEGQPATAGNVLQQIALAAGATNGISNLEVPENDEYRERHTNHRMTLRVNPPKVVPHEEKEVAPPNPKPNRRSRKQNLAAAKVPNPGTVAALIHVSSDTQPPAPESVENGAKKTGRKRGRKQTFNKVVDVVAEAKEQTKPVGSSKRKRKSPVRSTIADFLGEPEFTEMYYFEETDDEEEDSYTGNILHLMKERQRRRDMGGMFDLLHSLVVKGEKVSRNALLTLSVKEVKALRKKAERLKLTKAKQREQNIILRNKLAQFLGVTTRMEYQSEEEEEVERIGGYKSSSSAPDNDDDDESVDWGSSVASDEETGDADFGGMHQDDDSDEETNIKVELPTEEEEEEEGWNVRVRIKEEPVSEEEEEEEEEEKISVPEKEPDVFVRVKLEPTATEETSNYESPTTHRTADDLDYDRYERVKIEPRSPVRRALFSDSESGDLDSDRTAGKKDSATNGNQYSNAVPLSLHTNLGSQDDDDDSNLASSLEPEDQPEQIIVSIDPELIKQEGE